LLVIAITRLLWSGAGAAVALGLVLALVNPPTDILLLASFGGTAVFLFGLTRAPAAQPPSSGNRTLSGKVDGKVTTVVVLGRLG
jgi:CBS-domain-containing membrane protein